MAKIVVTAYGSAGDVLPYIYIGRALEKRGHRVQLITMEGYREAAQKSGLEIAPIPLTLPQGTSSAKVWQRAMDPVRGTMSLFEIFMPQLRAIYEHLREATRDADLLVSHSFAQAAPILAQATKMPWVSCVLSPMVFNSRFDPPTPSIRPQGAHRRLTGKIYARWFMRQAQRRFQHVLEPAYELRRELGLPTDKHPLFDGQHSPLRVLALFSPMFASPQPDWPEQTRTTGFCMDDEDRVLEPRLQQFLDEGDAPILWTLGASSIYDARDFWQKSLAITQHLGARAIWTVGKNREALPKNLPASIGVFEQVPLAQVMPRCRAVVHHGGVGTIAIALRASVPMLMVPQAHDQPTNATHAARLGSGRIVWRHDFNAKRVRRELNELLCNPIYAQRAREVQTQIASENGVQTACDEIERVLNR